MRSHARPCLFEPLDPRTLLSANFAGVGIAGADSDIYTAWSYVVEGSVTAQNQTTAAFVESGGVNPPVALGPIEGISLVQLGAGRMSTGHKGWLDPTRSVDDNVAASFFSDGGHAVGWTYTEYVEDWAVDDEFFLLVERPTDASLADLGGSWKFLWFGTDDDNAFIVEGAATVTGSQLSFVPASGDDNLGSGLSATIASVTADGLALLSEEPDARFYLNSDKTFVIFSMGGDSSTDPAIGVMFRSVAVTEENVIGSYRWSMGDDDDIGDDLDDSHHGFADGVLDVKSDHTFTIIDSASHDRGYDDSLHGSVRRTGTWSIVSDRLVLQTVPSTDDSVPLIFTLAADGNTLVSSAVDDDTVSLGLASRLIPSGVSSDTGVAVASYASRDDSGRPRIFELGDDRYWRDVDLSPFGPDSVNDLTSWVDEDDGRTFACAADDDDTTYYKREDDGSWSGHSLTALVPGSTPIVSQIEVMEDNSGSVHVMGLNASGQVVAFTLASGSTQWAFRNITLEDLASNSQDLPQFVGDLISYDTSWEGLNLAGIDASGDIWSIWWAPGEDHWNSSNLSRITGADAVNFVGGLTAYLTSWGGINLAGVDDSGDVRVVWWVPGAAWDLANMTDNFGGPQLTPSSVSSYRSSWDGLNIVGFDQNTGQVQVYWWAPGMDSWNVSSLSSAVGDDAIDPSTNLRGIAGADDSLNVIGRSSSGEIVRYYWEPEFEGDWLVENLDDCSYEVR